MVNPPNRLIHEKNPYLKKHASNPVDWYPWGDEAILKARKEDKPILLSIGYSTCHWCNVMERESFSNPEVASVMNRNLVSIKIDREERPDLDKIYITAVSAMTGSAGWPLNVFLTDELEPFFGGTYFPPSPRMNLPGWVDLVEAIGRAWRDPEKRKEIRESSSYLTGVVSKALHASPERGVISDKHVYQGYRAVADSFNETFGGFSKAPKFPVPVIHHFLLRYYSFARSRGRKEEAERALKMSLHTLRKMAEGGIFDHLGGGFHRYSTDETWQLPHFEKMLYDNGQLARVYLEAYLITGDTHLRSVGLETIHYVLRDLAHPEGGFYSAEDADSLPHELSHLHPDETGEYGKEGAFYVWTWDEVMKILRDDEGELFSYMYNIREGGNVSYDPVEEFSGKNVLHSGRSPAEAARKFGRKESEIQDVLFNGKRKLLHQRGKRPRPSLDGKIIPSWNGIFMSALSAAYRATRDKRYIESAKETVSFLKKELFDGEKGTLYRSWKDGRGSVVAFSDDYANLAQGLIDLYEATFEVTYLTWARELTEIMVERFYDKARGGVYLSDEGHDPHLILRVREDYDNVEPSSSSVGAMNILRLDSYYGEGSFQGKAQETMENFSGIISNSHPSLPFMLSAFMYNLEPPCHIVLQGNKNDGRTRGLAESLLSLFLPNKVVIWAQSEKDFKNLGKYLDIPQTGPWDETPSARVCIHNRCLPPVYNGESLIRQLRNEELI
jgi:uncharacterized protein YyaL (SSP411 family)